MPIDMPVSRRSYSRGTVGPVFRDHFPGVSEMCAQFYDIKRLFPVTGGGINVRSLGQGHAAKLRPRGQRKGRDHAPLWQEPSLGNAIDQQRLPMVLILQDLSGVGGGEARVVGIRAGML